MEVSQTLVSTTWSIEGPSATGAYPTKSPAGRLSLLPCRSSHCISVFFTDGNSGYIGAELWHPLPVLEIQWRPSVVSHLHKGAPRHVLLTSCMDGTVRLWGEIEDNRARKTSKDNRDPSASNRSFCVIGVIEISQSLHGTLGTDIFVNWCSEVEGLDCVSGGESLLSSKKPQKNEVGRCEWLIGFGPGKTLTFWAVHCLDDIATMRSPRITLWKTLEIQGLALTRFCGDDHPRYPEGSYLKKVAMWRSRLSGPPNICSFVQLLPCNSLAWSMLYSHSLLNAEDNNNSPKCETDGKLSLQSEGMLDIIGHTGKILQIAVHPFKYEVELAVSLDSNGLLLFWSICSSPSSISSLPTINPSWQLIGKMALQSIISHDVRLYWAPSLLDEDRILLTGHLQGIECLIIRACETKEAKILCHKLCTIPYVDHDCIDVPDEIISVPLRSTCKTTFSFNCFLLLGVWMKHCQVKSWKVTLHSYELSGNCCSCNLNDAHTEGSSQIYKSNFAGITYCVVVDPLSSYLPDVHDQVTSVAMVSPSMIIPSLQQKLDLANDSFLDSFPYLMATGHSDGRSRLWRISLPELSVACSPFELVGTFSYSRGPITALAVADWGQKIATICRTSDSNGANMLCIWEPLHLAGMGTVQLEDKICLNGNVVALQWFLMENILFLGVCFQNELHIYSRRVCGGQTSLNMTKPSEASIWISVAVVRTSSAICNFVLGPRATIIVIHDKHFSVFSQWSFLTGDNHLADGHLNPDRALFLTNEIDPSSPGVFATEVPVFGGLLLGSSKPCSSVVPSLKKGHNDVPSFLLASCSRPVDRFENMNCFWKLTEVAEKFCGHLPFYHPETLMMNIHSGNWKRAYVAVSHLVECQSQNLTAEQRPKPAKSSLKIRQVKLSNYFEGQVSSGGVSQGFQWSIDLNTSTSSSYSGLVQLTDSSVQNAINSLCTASTTDIQKMKMFAIIDLLREISVSQSASAYGSLDEPGRRFWCAIRLQQLDFQRRYSRLPSIEELVVDSRLIGWALHSDGQANLFGTFLTTEPTWEEMRKMGAGFWFTNITDLRSKMEKLARCRYLKRKDPKACALLYISLNRLQVLAGLFKISKDEKDKPLVAFLSRNFQEEKHKAAALKNAYVLMGRHQFEMAIAFFLLGGDVVSAISVCAKNLGDDQLALVICRLVEGLGGPSERHLISKILLPAAIEKGDYWLASILEWISGNYLQSFLTVLGLRGDSHVSESEKSFQHAVFLDPSVGEYCRMLATKNSLRNAIGEQNAAILCRWATVMTASAFNKCGFPLEALEWMSSSPRVLGGTENGTDHGNSEILPRILRPALVDSSRWLSHEVACHLEYEIKLDLAVQYIMKLLREHPCWFDSHAFLSEVSAGSQEYELSQYRSLLENFEQKLDSALAYLEQKFSLSTELLLNKIFASLDDDRLVLIGYQLSYRFASQVRSHALTQSGSSQLLKHFTNAAEYLSYSVSRFITASTIASSRPLASSEHDVPTMKPKCYFQYLEFYLRGITFSTRRLRAAMMVLFNDDDRQLNAHSISILNLCNYCTYFASAMLQCNIKALAALLQPLSSFHSDGSYLETDMVSLRTAIGDVVGALRPKHSSADTYWGLRGTQESRCENGQDKTLMIPEDEKWLILGTCLWQHLSKFITYELKRLSDRLTCNSVADTSVQGSGVSPELDDNGSVKPVKEVLMTVIEAIGNTVAYLSSNSARELSVLFWHKFSDGTSVPTQMWFKESRQSNSSSLIENQDGLYGTPELLIAETLSSCSEVLASIVGDPKPVSETLSQLQIKLSQLIQWKPVRGWNHLNIGVIGEYERLESYKQEGIFDRSPRGNENGIPSTSSELCHSLPDSTKTGASIKKVVPFHNPREIYRKNGELLEALCINSIEQRQAALVSNKKGISFFNWGDDPLSRNPSDWFWSKADWPQNGWAGAESTPIPTCVSPGVGLGSDEGFNLGLGGATVGIGSQARVGRDMTGGGAFGIPGYAGIGAAGMGWGIQEGFENLLDPPANLDNINARTLASHPSKPFFLVGSNNTHIYLWEFGEEKAAGTYGVLPAANVPPPYALASITGLKFDRCGHRFANSASDGTVCTWQLEVGGRSNVRPTESSVCFNGHASDVCYVATSGSVIAATGYSSNGVNVVIWDTLAPPTSSRASVMCHEGGASSIAVFDNDMGTSSVSPLIVTGGKGGDVGLHDFRYIATGKTKRHRHSNTADRITDISALDVQPELSSNAGDQNRHGMLWYIPKAHSGSVTKITTIPNTSLFLTGSKDGDVKLWDAKRASLVFHWPKLHERQTFLQRSSQGFGGVTRVGVTDIQAVSDGFLTCGGDGSVKLVLLNNFQM